MRTTEYCLGFLFSSDGRVALIDKTHPKWQAGRSNGIGGKIEATEDSRVAMVREFKEEAGIPVPFERWKFFGEIVGPTWKVYLYASEIDQVHDYVRLVTQNDETPFWASGIPGNAIDNLNFLVPMARYALDHLEFRNATVRYDP